jgi:hypothetical protein
MKRWTIGCCCLLSLLSSTAWAQHETLSRWERLAEWLNPQTSPFIPIPEIATDPNTGTTLGVLPVMLFTDAEHEIRRILAPDINHNPNLGTGGTLRLFAYPSEDTQWYVTAGGSQVIARGVEGFYTTGVTRQQQWSLTGRILYDQDPTQRFFGIGNGSKLGDQTNYTLNQKYVETRFGLNFSPTLQVAIDIRPRFVKIESGAFPALPFTGSRFPTLDGVGSEHELGTQLLLSYDTRDSIAIPTHGGQIAAFAGLVDEHLLSSVSYRFFGVEGRDYRRIGDRLTLASHIALRYMPGSGSIPFWALSRLGGDRSILGDRQPLRGYGEGRFVDRNLFVANVELRSRVIETTLFTTHVTFELAPFVDVGRVFAHMDDNPLSYLHAAGGLGFRAMAKPFIVGYVDVGYGNEGVAVFSGVDYPF